VYSDSLDFDTYTYSHISCSGPAYANAVSVKVNGSSTVNATLDPASPDCESLNVFAKITVTADGQFDGNYAYSGNGNVKETFVGSTNKYNNKSDNWSQTFSADNGFYSGTFTGYADMQQINNRQKVK
jgi:phage gp45-like